jgi:predicted AlkP superfamily phosphohydrolase/phosphomutase
VEFRDALLRVYQALDRAVGELVERAGGEGTRVMILSDHGFGGAGLKTFYLNRWLWSEGLLEFVPRRGSGDSLVNRLKRWGMRRVPPSLQEQLFRRFSGRIASRIESASRYGAIHWPGTRAYSDELNYFPSIWINQRGREPGGTVEPGEDHRLTLERIVERLAELKDPETGEPVVARAWPREELYFGPCLERAPDLVLELNLDRGYSYTCLSTPAGDTGPIIDRIPTEDRLGAKGKGMNGTHRRDGILLLSGEGCASGRVDGAGLEDLAPTLLHLMGIEVPAQMDGRVLTEALSPVWLRQQPVPESRDRGPRVGRASTKEPVIFTPEEEDLLRQRLQGLGYLEEDD